MPQKSVYLDADIIKWLEKQAKKETRTFSNYLSKLVRDRILEANCKFPQRKGKS